MKDQTLRYIDTEVRYLCEAAKEFVQTHLGRAAMLDLDKAGTPVILPSNCGSGSGFICCWNDSRGYSGNWSRSKRSYLYIKIHDFTLLLETQTVACRTGCVIGDVQAWEAIAAPLMTIGAAHDATWQPAERIILEQWCGMPGAMAPWLLAALAADMVSLRHEPLLTLFSAKKEHFVSTVTSGSEDEHIG